MSTISTRHTVNLFVAGKSQALTGQRLAKVGFKLTEKMKEKGLTKKDILPNICVSVPHIDTENDPFVAMRAEGAFDSIIKSALENAQDGIIRSLYESSGGNLSSVGDEEIGIAQCLAYIEAENSGGRLTKDFLCAWFDASLKDNLSVVIAEKLKFEELTEEQVAVIGKHLNGYRDLFSSLAGGKTVLSEKQIKNLQNALELVTVEDDTHQKLCKRLEEMGRKEKIEDLLEL